MESATGRTLARSRDLDFLWDFIQLIATKAQMEAIRYLLKMEWDCDIQAFNNAIDSGSTEVVQMFIDGDPFLVVYVGSHNKTCLDVALNGYMPREKTVPMLRLLLANSTDPKQANSTYMESGIFFLSRSRREARRHGAAAGSGLLAYSHIRELSRDGTSFG
jgi:hypothetical protein